MSQWSAFFAALASAAATLAGLVFVAVSINLDRVLEHRLLPLHALEGLVALMSVLFVSILGLVPDQTTAEIGSEITCIGLLAAAFQLWSVASTHRVGKDFPRYWVRVLCCVLPAPPFIVSGLLIAQGVTAAGGRWLAAGVLLSFCAALTSAWVLLIEIKR